MDKIDIDRKGYSYWKDSGKLVHRTIAYKEIYLKDRKKYPLPFSQYQVHHKDKNKLNNKLYNLELIPIKEHEKKHNIIRRESLEIVYIKVLIIGFLGILGVEGLSKIIEMNLWIKGLLFFLVFIITFFIALYLSKEKEGIKYI